MLISQKWAAALHFTRGTLRLPPNGKQRKVPFHWNTLPKPVCRCPATDEVKTITMAPCVSWYSITKNNNSSHILGYTYFFSSQQPREFTVPSCSCSTMGQNSWVSQIPFSLVKAKTIRHSISSSAYLFLRVEVRKKVRLSYEQTFFSMQSKVY